MTGHDDTLVGHRVVIWMCKILGWSTLYEIKSEFVGAMCGLRADIPYFMVVRLRIVCHRFLFMVAKRGGEETCDER